MSGHVLPSVADTYDLGSVAKYWREVRVRSLIAQTLQPQGSELQIRDNAQKITFKSADPTYRICATLDLGYLNIQRAGPITQLDNYDIIFGRNVLPLTDVFQDIGSTTKKILNLYGWNYSLFKYRNFRPTTAPAGALEGDMYYHGTDKKHRGFDGTSWHDLY